MNLDELPTFFMTYARSRPDTIIPHVESEGVPLLTNAVHRWSDATESFLDMWEYDTLHVIDAGGYNVQSQYVDRWGNVDVENTDLVVERMSDTPWYPWSVEQYHDWLTAHAGEIGWATVMDYACEERFDELWSVEDRIEGTFENTLRHAELLDDEYRLLPVLQGRTLDDYLDFYSRLEDHGLPTDYVGVGTICRLSSETKIAEIEQGLREHIDDVRLHGFGAKIQAFKYGATFDSADSQAWAHYPTNGLGLIHTDGRLEKVPMKKTNLSLERTTMSFKSYYTYVSELFEDLHGDGSVELSDDDGEYGEVIA